MPKPTNGDALRTIASNLFALRNDVALTTFEKLMKIRSELTALAAKEDEYLTAFKYGDTLTDDS